MGDTQAPELVGGYLPHTVQLADRQRGNKGFDFIGGDHKQAIGFTPVTGDLGQELVRCHPSRHRDMQLLGYPTANIGGYARGTAGEPGAVGNIQVGFVQRQRLDQVGVIAKDRVNFPRCFFISIHTWLDDQQIGAQVKCMSGRHRRTHPIRPSLVVAGSNDATPLSRAPYRQRPSSQARVVTHFNSGVEAIAINMDDLALGHRQP
ncbi:hypothetical protein D3C78_1365820 [compost metagenome]